MNNILLKIEQLNKYNKQKWSKNFHFQKMNPFFLLLYLHIYKSLKIKWLIPAQDVHFFYTRSHFSAIQNCALIFSTNFHFIFPLKKCTSQFSYLIVKCAKNIQMFLRLFINSRTVLKLLIYWLFAKTQETILLLKRALIILAK